MKLTLLGMVTIFGVFVAVGLIFVIVGGLAGTRFSQQVASVDNA